MNNDIYLALRIITCHWCHSSVYSFALLCMLQYYTAEISLLCILIRIVVIMQSTLHISTSQLQFLYLMCVEIPILGVSFNHIKPSKYNTAYARIICDSIDTNAINGKSSMVSTRVHRFCNTTSLSNFMIVCQNQQGGKIVHKALLD